jgi:hypothetical protein
MRDPHADQLTVPLPPFGDSADRATPLLPGDAPPAPAPLPFITAAPPSIVAPPADAELLYQHRRRVALVQAEPTSPAEPAPTAPRSSMRASVLLVVAVAAALAGLVVGLSVTVAFRPRESTPATIEREPTPAHAGELGALPETATTAATAVPASDPPPPPAPAASTSPSAAPPPTHARAFHPRPAPTAKPATEHSAEPAEPPASPPPPRRARISFPWGDGEDAFIATVPDGVTDLQHWGEAEARRRRPELGGGTSVLPLRSARKIKVELLPAVQILE